MANDASSISVAVRVRPFTIREAAQLTKTDDSTFFLGEGSLAGAPAPKLTQKGIRPIIKVVDDRCLVFDPPEDNPIQKFSKSVVPQGKRVKDQTFAFDRVFDENITQGDVYDHTTRPLLDSVFDGYNATVFAYGATGCGKTHTITGTVQQPGIIFLTMQELFERIAESQSEKVTEISLSYLEIYNETIRDLLVPGGSKQGLMLREDANQAVSVAGLSSHHPQNVQEVMDMIVRGNEYRTMSPTEANATSSRSHAVLQINVSSKDRDAGVNEPHTMATLSIIDLAGSERASATKNRGERLIEGANINRSLLALGSCINALCDPRKKNHVPYRNSKLTRLLKFSLGGNCKTVMIVCVSPSSVHFDETQNTLRYANRAKNIQTKVTRNVFNVNRHVKDFLKKIDEQMQLINELKAQQKDHETVAFGKFRKVTEKREAIAREGIQRLRSSYDHSGADRHERTTQMKKLRQIERRIALVNSWMTAFDEVCEIRDEEEPPTNLVAMQKTAQGILVELESSRHHFHQKLSKCSWQRAIETALQTGIKNLQELDEGANDSDVSNLEREAELLKSNAECEFRQSILDSEKEGDAALIKLLLHAHFETIAIINQLQSMSEEEAVEAAKGVLSKMMQACSEATSQVVRADGTLPMVDPAPPSKSGTPKRKRAGPLLGPSPAKTVLPPPILENVRLASSPVRPSPRRHLLGGGARRNVVFTPKRKSPTKRAVRWKDDEEDGKLAEYQKTPQTYDSTPTNSSVELPPPPPQPEWMSDEQSNAANTQQSSSPIPPVPETAFEPKPSAKFDRFAAGFLSRKVGNTPPPTAKPSALSSSPEPSPLGEISGNRKTSRPSLDKSHAVKDFAQADSAGTTSGSDSEGPWKSEENQAYEINKAMKRASLGRPNSIREANRVHRRRSPPAAHGNPSGSPQSDSASGTSSSMFTASHARRMVKGEHQRNSSVLSPHPASGAIVKSDKSSSSVRRNTIDDKGMRPPSSTARPGHVRMSSINSTTNSVRNSILGTPKTVWR